MATHDGELGRERKELFPDRGEDRLGVASPEVRPADRAPEECVAGKEQDGRDLTPRGDGRDLTPCRGQTPEKEARRTGRVSRRVDRLEMEPPNRDRLAVFEAGVGRDRRLRGETEIRSLVGQRVVERPVAVVDPDRGAGRALQPRRATDVVEVPVRVKESDRLALRRREREEDPVRLVARVDDDRLARVQIGDDRAVALERPDRDRSDEGCGQGSSLR